jgi:hypothetical protein
VANPGAAQADAHFHLAVLYVTGATGKADYSRALQHFNSASHAGHLMAVYNLALMHLTGLGIPVSCPTALALLKSVAERGLWSQVLQRAHAAFLQVRCCACFSSLGCVFPRNRGITSPISKSTNVLALLLPMAFVCHTPGAPGQSRGAAGAERAARRP